MTIALIGILFISIAVASTKFENRTRVRIWSMVALGLILFLVGALEDVYKSKSWYGPSFYPPGDYISGPIANDQGNNI